MEVPCISTGQMNGDGVLLLNLAGEADLLLPLAVGGGDADLRLPVHSMGRGVGKAEVPRPAHPPHTALHEGD